MEIMLRHREEVKAIYLAAGEEQSDFKEHLRELVCSKHESVVEAGIESAEMLNNLMELADMLGIDVSEECDERE